MESKPIPNLSPKAISPLPAVTHSPSPCSKRPNRPTAIFAGSDLQAMGVYEAARQLGLRIPEDVSVVGFDDVQTAAFLGPALTTVRQPLQDMARAAVRMLVEALSTNDVIQPHIIMPTSLVVRNSTQQLEG